MPAECLTAGIVLAGGRSSRMGSAKAELEWHGSTLLNRAVTVLADAVSGPVVVVGAPGQALPALPPSVEVLTDPVPGVGPLQGLAVGLAALRARAPAAFLCATDMPFLQPAFVRRVLHELTDPRVDVALPMAHGFRQPLAAAYRTELADIVAGLLAGGARTFGQLFERCRVRLLTEEQLLSDPELARLDPTLESLRNINTPTDYADARALPTPSPQD
jgi:molybdenum cofactor guanylyltransferase